jgi:hypothetical protein
MSTLYNHKIEFLHAIKHNNIIHSLEMTSVELCSPSEFLDELAEPIKLIGKLLKKTAYLNGLGPRNRNLISRTVCASREILVTVQRELDRYDIHEDIDRDELEAMTNRFAKDNCNEKICPCSTEQYFEKHGVEVKYVPDMNELKIKMSKIVDSVKRNADTYKAHLTKIAKNLPSTGLKNSCIDSSARLGLQTQINQPMLSNQSGPSAQSAQVDPSKYSVFPPRYNLSISADVMNTMTCANPLYSGSKTQVPSIPSPSVQLDPIATKPPVQPVSITAKSPISADEIEVLEDILQGCVKGLDFDESLNRAEQKKNNSIVKRKEPDTGFGEVTIANIAADGSMSDVNVSRVNDTESTAKKTKLTNIDE